MKFPNRVYAVESVLRGHPDKICDQISDGLLDQFLKTDPDAHTAIECLGTKGTLVVAGEVSSTAILPIEQCSQEIYNRITGYSGLKIINLLSQQSPQLAKAVINGGAGDQGVMYGYACDNHYNYLPYGYWLVNMLAKRLDLLRTRTHSFEADGKIQAVLSENTIIKLTINVQHIANADLPEINNLIRQYVLFDIENENIAVNPDKEFICGGFDNDTGLTGRKIIIDAYGGLAPHGGGAFSGKDPSKVDRSAAYMCRYVAKNIVANGLAKDCTVSVAYNFGEANPAMLRVVADGNDSTKMRLLVKQKFDFRPQAIIEQLKLKRPIYFSTAAYGHFTDLTYPWECIIEL